MVPLYLSPLIDAFGDLILSADDLLDGLVSGRRKSGGGVVMSSFTVESC